MGLIKAGIVLGGIYLIAKNFREERQCSRSKRNYHEDPSNPHPRSQNNQGYPPDYNQYPAPSQYKGPQMSDNSGYRNEKQIYNGTPNVDQHYSEPKMIGENQYAHPRVPGYDDSTSNQFQRTSNEWSRGGQWQENAVKN